MESNALVRSMKAIIKVCSLHFSWICHAEKIMSAVPRAGLKPHWDSGRVSLAMGKRQHARTQDLPNNRKQGEFPQFVLSPFLKMETIRASCKIAGNYLKKKSLNKFINVTKHLANQLLYRNSHKSNQIKSNQMLVFGERGKPEYPGENLS